MNPILVIGLIYMLFVAMCGVFGILAVVDCFSKEELEFKIGIILLKYALIWPFVLPLIAKCVTDHYKEE